MGGRGDGARHLLKTVLRLGTKMVVQEITRMPKARKESMV